jgi:U3 small nucleolar RNA-associated protein 13
MARKQTKSLEGLDDLGNGKSESDSSTTDDGSTTDDVEMMQNQDGDSGDPVDDSEGKSASSSDDSSSSKRQGDKDELMGDSRDASSTASSESDDDDDDDDNDNSKDKSDDTGDNDNDKSDAEEENSDEEMEQASQENPSSANNASKPKSAARLSKSWSIQTAHLPIYTGGKISHIAHTQPPLFFLPIGGDLCIVDAHRAVRLSTLRGDSIAEDQDELDGEDIVAHAVAPNSTILITCTRHSRLQQYVLESTKASLVKSWGRSGHTLPVTHMDFHSSSVFLATGSVDGSVRVWDVRGGYCTHVYRPVVDEMEESAGTRRVTCLQWKKSGLVLAIGRDDGSITIHNLNDKDNACVLRDHVSAVTCIDWDASGEWLITSGRDAVINTWQRVHEKKKKGKGGRDMYSRVHTLPVYEQVESMILFPPPGNDNDDSFVVITAGSRGRVRIWRNERENDRAVLKLAEEQSANQSFGEARGGYTQLLLTTGATKGNEGDSCVVAVDAEHNLTYLSLQTHRMLHSTRTIVGHNDDILDLKIIPNPSQSFDRIAVVTNSSQVRLFNINSFSCQVLDKHTSTVLCIDVSPCGRFLATCAKDRTVRIWYAETGVAVAVAKGHTEAVGSATLSRKITRYGVQGKAAYNGGGAFVVSASIDRTVKRWNLPGINDLMNASRGEEEIELTAAQSARAHEKDINIVSIAPNDTLIATGSQDRTVKIWRANDLSLLGTLKGHKRGVWDCQFSSVDRVVATGSGDQTIRLWSLKDYSCVRTFQGHTSSVLRVRFINSGLQVVSSGGDGLLKLWTIRTNECEASMDGHTDRVWALDISPDGRTLVSGGADSRIVVWNDTTEEIEHESKVMEEEAILLDQQLANYMRHKDYSKALEIALQSDKPFYALKIFDLILEASLDGVSGVDVIMMYVKQWHDERLLQILQYCREWNTRSMSCYTALIIVRAIVSSIQIPRLISIPNAPEIIAGIIPYAERHFDRIDKLCANSYLLDFVSVCMGNLGQVSYDGNDERLKVWEDKSKLVLPAVTEGRRQIGGAAVVVSFGKKVHASDESIESVGESDSYDSLSAVDEA